MAETKRCYQCGRKLTDKHIPTKLELSNTNNKFYEYIPEGHLSQGCFNFGSTCAKRVLKTGELDYKAKHKAEMRLDWDGISGT
tara:strand:+ start:910 stop:1158 length:249 start_codon:yes stop_codon:yes gene_type:complete